MKTYITLFFIALAVLQCIAAPASDSVESTESAEGKMTLCESKAIFNKECNTCTCSNDGTSFACTKMACPPGVFNEDGTLKVSLPTLTATAPAGEVTTEASSNVVTEKVPKIPWGPLYEDGTPCPDKSFYSECNQCKCGGDGKSAFCTLKACDAWRPLYESQKDNLAKV